MKKNKRLKDKIAIITGAGSGIGRETAYLFANEGAKLTICDKFAKKLRAVSKQINESGGKVVPLKINVTNESEIKVMIKKTIQEFGRIDILVNNAGTVVRKNLEGTTERDFKYMIDNDLKSVFICIKHVVPHMKSVKKGKIVNISSIAAHSSYGYPGYSSAKGGILGLTKSLVGDLANYGITINAISPGVIETSINKKTLSNPKIRKKTIDLIPLGRLGKAKDIAKSILFFSSEDSDFITGQVLKVDGGMTSVIQFGDTAKLIGTFQQTKN